MLPLVPVLGQPIGNAPLRPRCQGFVKICLLRDGFLRNRNRVNTGSICDRHRKFLFPNWKQFVQLCVFNHDSETYILQAIPSMTELPYGPID